MSSKTSSNEGATTPLLEAVVDHSHGQEEEEEEEEEQEQGSRRHVCAVWWNEVLDLDEAKHQILFSLPMTLTTVFYYLITLISVMFAGHLGELELAGATLANSWSTVTGFAFMVGLSGALETLCGQGFGAKEFRVLGIYLQSASVISFIFSIILSIIWLYTETILVLLRQSQDIAEASALYIKFLIPGLFAYGFLQNILRFLQTQSIVLPLVLLSGLPLIAHVGIAYALVHWTELGFKGAPIAASITLWISFIVLALYVNFSKNFSQTWQGFSLESFSFILGNLKLALPSAAMICLEYWAFEVLVILAGLMQDAEISTSLIAICVNTEAIAYMVSYGLSAAVSTRVSNELGADHSNRAKNAMFVGAKLSVLLAIVIVLALAFGHSIWAGLFSSSSSILEQFASITPFLAASITADCIQSVLSGVVRGCGWQHLAVFLNLANFYIIGLPVACVLGFKFNMHAKGLWIGSICGLCCQAITLLVITQRVQWTKMNATENIDKENSHCLNQF